MLKSFLKFAAAAALSVAAPALAQVETIDPDQAGSQAAETETLPSDTEADAQAEPAVEWSDPELAAPAAEPADATQAGAPTTAEPTVPREDLVQAAENLFGRGAEGLGGILERILREQGEPTAYISGREASGAFVIGLRYGSGTLRHSIEGERTIYWTGPSIGFDAGADASKVFVLVYNLHDSQDLFRRFPGAEGNAYFVGGFTAQYLRRGDVVLIPIRLGVGVRLGVNAGYMRVSQRNRWLPF